jgi:hypothetical protein
MSEDPFVQQGTEDPVAHHEADQAGTTDQLSVTKDVEPEPDESDGVYFAVAHPYSELNVPDAGVHLGRVLQKVPAGKADAVREAASRFGVRLRESDQGEEE